MVILGIDPGLANTGWGVIETRGSQCRARAYGCVHTDKDLTLPMRLKRIHDEIAEVIMRYSPMEVAVEEIFFCSNAQRKTPHRPDAAFRFSFSSSGWAPECGRRGG